MAKINDIQISLFPITNKVKKAVERVNMFEDVSKDNPIWLATSKGKDSLVLEYIFALSRVAYEKHFSLTSVDPPELVKFAKEDKELTIDIPRYEDGKQKTMWNLIPKKKMPPTRLVRYCCSELKECFGVGRITATGVRWEESINRRNNQGEALIHDLGKASKAKTEELQIGRITARGGLVLNLDNTESRRMVENCYRTRKTLVNPIIDFTNNEVWEIIRGEKIRYCELYDCGYKRLGCIGCPMAGPQGQLEEFKKRPTYKIAYIRAFDRMLSVMQEGTHSWKNGEDVFAWWVGGYKEKSKIEIEGQQSWFEELGLPTEETD